MKSWLFTTEGVYVNLDFLLKIRLSSDGYSILGDTQNSTYVLANFRERKDAEIGIFNLMQNLIIDYKNADSKS